MTALILPGLEVGAGLWQLRNKDDRAANALADRHYSRRRPGSGQIGPPGRKLVFVTPCERAVWLTHWPYAHLSMDGLDAWRCSIFRNEGAGLSSDLIRAAMDLTALLWANQPAPGGVEVRGPCSAVSASTPGAALTGSPAQQHHGNPSLPADGWITWVDAGKVRHKRDPGRCFIKAGWWVDRGWSRGSMIRLRAKA